MISKFNTQRSSLQKDSKFAFFYLNFYDLENNVATALD